MSGTQLFTVLIALILILIAFRAGATARRRRDSKEAASSKRNMEVAAVQQLVFEDVTAFGEDLQQLDSEMGGHALDAGANADYQRALDAYEGAKSASNSISEPDDVRHVTEIIDDGRYAIACVRARVSSEPLPIRRPPCFFDPRHGPSVADVPYAPSAGVEREVPACALDAERIRSGADPDVRKVFAGEERVPYWQGGRAYQPYALGYFAALDPLTWLFLASFAFDGYGGNEHPDGGENGSDHRYAMDDASDSGGSTLDGGGDFSF